LKSLWDEVGRLLQQAGIGDFKLEFPKQKGYGDIYTNAAFELAKKQRKNPYQIAQDIASKIDLTNSRFVSKVEAAPPGYLNFHAKWPALAEEVLRDALDKRERYGEVDLGKNRYVLVEHTSVNPNKAIHIGHARNICLGDSLARLLAKTNHRVAVANYIDDSGAQMAELLLAFTRLGYSPNPPDNTRFDEYCGQVYSEVSRRIENDPGLEAMRREINLDLERQNPAIVNLNNEVVDRVLKCQLQTCWRLGARYDVLNRESDIIAFDLWRTVFELLVKKNAVYMAEDGPKKGCWMIKLSDHPILSKEGDEVLIKSDGATTYVARDIAYAAWKLGLLSIEFSYRVWGHNPDKTPIYITDLNGSERQSFGRADLTINVVDVRQKRPQSIVKHALEKLGVEGNRYIHYAYEVVSLSKHDAEQLNVDVEGQQFVHMSGRKGVYVNVDPLLDYVKAKASAGAAERHPEWSSAKIEEVGEKIAVAALRYFLLRSDPEKMIVFDSEEASDIEGDTGPYIQYAYARATRIVEKADAKPSIKAYSEELDESERELIKMIGLLPFVFEEAVRLLSVKTVVNYVRDLSISFNNFYERCPVLSSDDAVKSFRLALVEGFRAALASAAYVVGIPLIEEM